jgi:hypothetical protein
MRYKQKHSLLNQITCLLLFVQIINLSTDIKPPMNKYTGQRDLSFNNIDSMVEYILEDALNLGNVIKENNDPYRNLNIQNFQTFSPTFNSDPVHNCDYLVLNGDLLPHYILSFKSEFIREIIPPPPKA